MISTKTINKNKTMGLTPSQRKEKVAKLREEHDDYFQNIGNLNAVYIPKMAYRPSGKDDLHISFFPSEMEKQEDVYTEFVSINYDNEDPKRTLYLHKYNPHWKEEYELITSNSGFERHLVPVNELKIINDVTSRGKANPLMELEELPDPDDKPIGGIDKNERILASLDRIAKALEDIQLKLNK